jgi:acetyl esterase/lipase
VTDDLPYASADVSVSRALSFATIPGYRPLELDLYRPPADRPLPAVIYLHGGGWRQGTRQAASPGFRDWNPGLLTRLAAAGFVVASADYRLSGEARFPAQLDDVYRAVDWVTASGEAHGIDPSRILLWGDSAGGHLAALAATGGPQCPQLRGVVAWYPITDLPSIQADADAVGGEPHNTPEARETALIGALIQDDPSAARQASPVTHATTARAPFFLAHGNADLVSPYQQSIRLRDALLAAGKEVTLYTVEGAGHMWQGASRDQLHALLGATFAFLRQHSELTAARAQEQ